MNCDRLSELTEEPPMAFSTCDLYDEHGDAFSVIGSELPSFGKRKSFTGLAVTIKCFEDNSRIKEASLERGEGRVLVVDAGGSTRVAVLGDMIARDAMNNGWAGIIVFGCVRDRQALAELDIGVHALGTTPRKSVRRGEGQRDLDIQVAGVWFRSGDTVYADVDGILVRAQDDGKRG
jgi:regulator of ribonuclease activity A